MLTKKCTKCKTVRYIKNFRKRKDKKHYYSWCKKCANEASRTFNNAHYSSSKNRKYYLKNRVHILEYSKQYHARTYKECRTHRLKREKQWRKDNKKRLSADRKRQYRRRKFTPQFRYNTYKSSARVRGIRWALTIEQFMLFWKKPCGYCGNTIRCIGLDRINNSKNIGYIKRNLRPCCRECNVAKRNKTVHGFIGHCRRVMEYMESKRKRRKQCRP